MTDFLPITEKDGSFEPTLLRDTDGALLFTARGPSGGTKPVTVWRSDDDGGSWEKVIDAPDARAGSAPVALGRAADGTPYIIAHPPEAARHHPRESLSIWPISDDRRALGAPLAVRRCADEFKDLHAQNVWSADNAGVGVLRLADGRWHGLFTYRVAHAMEIVKAEPMTPVTGSYVGKVHTDGPAAPVWMF